MKKVKKVGALLLALVMCLSVSIVAFGASSPSTTGTITVDGYAGEEYSVYQIFELTYDEDVEGAATDASSYAYKVVSAWEDFIKGYTITVGDESVALFTLQDNGYLDPSSAIFDYDDDSDVMAAFAKAAIAYAETNDIDPTDTKVAEAVQGATPDPETGVTDGTAVFSGLDLGYYVVSSSIGAVVSLDSTNNDVTISDKNALPTISKYVADYTYNDDIEEDETADDADNGDTIEYELVIDNVANAKSLTVHDYMDEQLKAETINIVSVTLYASIEDEIGTELTENEGYTYTAGECSQEDCGLDGCTFEISIADSVLYSSDLTSTAYIKIIYTVQLDEDLDDFEDDVDEIDNYANITFGNAAVGVPVETETFSYGFSIYKYTTVAGGELVEGTGTLTESGEDHMIVFTGVPEGEYYLAFHPSTSSANTIMGVEAYHVGTLEDTLTYDADAGVYTLDGDLASNNINGNQDEYIVVTVDGTMLLMLSDDLSFAYNNTWYLVPVGYEGTCTTETVESLGGVTGTDGYYTYVPAEYTEDSQKALANAEFILSKETDDGTVYATFEQDPTTGIYMFEGWVDDKDNATAIVSDEDGLIHVDGLHDGTFTLTETKAPDGYNLLDDSITVVITPSGNYSSFTITQDGTEVDLVSVENLSGTELPSTGGIGTAIFYIVGGAIVLAAVVLLVARRRTNRGEAEAE